MRLTELAERTEAFNALPEAEAVDPSQDVAELTASIEQYWYHGYDFEEADDIAELILSEDDLAHYTRAAEFVRDFNDVLRRLVPWDV